MQPARPDPIFISSEDGMIELGLKLAAELSVGDLVALSGPLGAGKTTLVRGILQGRGWSGPVRSPTFELIHRYPLSPPVLHCDLYRVSSWQGIGLEDYGDDHVILVEWPDRLGDFRVSGRIRHIDIQPVKTGRKVIL
jgi:tRNA threonylcarbamoyladenosine biosynthesis protein TsaE